MVNENSDRFRILYYLVQNRFLIIKNVLIFTILSAIIALVFFPNWYKSTAKIIIPEESQAGFSNLLSSIPFNDFLTSGLGSSVSIENITSVMESRSIKDHMIKKFKLDSVYRYTGDYYYEDLLDEFSENVEIDSKNRQGSISLSIYDTNPRLAKNLTNYYIHFVDTTLNRLYSTKARESRIFLRSRINETENELDSLNRLMESFQKDENVLSIKDQVKSSVDLVGKLYADLAEQEIGKNVISRVLGQRAPEYKELLVNIEETKKKLDEMVGIAKSKDDYVIALKDYPKLSLEYYNLFKEITIREKVLEYLYPQYEQAKLDEQKKLSNILIVDDAEVAERKSFPHRSFYIIGIALLVFLVTCSWILIVNRMNEYLRNVSDNYLYQSIQALKNDWEALKYKIIKRKK